MQSVVTFSLCDLYTSQRLPQLVTYTSHIGFDSEAIRSVIPVVNQLWQSAVILDGSACLDEIHHQNLFRDMATFGRLTYAQNLSRKICPAGGTVCGRRRRGPTCEVDASSTRIREEGTHVRARVSQRKPECMPLVLQMQQPAEALGLAERLSFRTAVCLDMLSCIVLMSRMPMTCSILARKLLPANFTTACLPTSQQLRHSGSV